MHKKVIKHLKRDIAESKKMTREDKSLIKSLKHSTEAKMEDKGYECKMPKRKKKQLFIRKEQI